MKDNQSVIEVVRRIGDQNPYTGTPHDTFATKIKKVDSALEQTSIDMIFRFNLMPTPSLNFVSPSCQHITGYAPEEYYADQDLIRRIAHPEDRRFFRDLGKPGGNNSAVIRWVRKDGAIIRTEQSHTVIYDECNKPVEAYIISRDITEHRKAEEALRENEDKYKTIFENINAVIVRCDKYGKIIEVNSRIEDIFGVKREEVIGKHFSKLGVITMKDLPKLVNLFKEAIMGRLATYNGKLETRDKNGNRIFIDVNSAVVKKEGKIEGIIAIVNNITEQKLAEQALRENEEFTTSLLNSNPNPIFVTYLDFSIKYVNPAFEKLTGFSLSEIIGMKMPYPWWPVESRQEIVNNFKQDRSGKAIKWEMAYQNKNGKCFWVKINAAFINQNGARKYILINWVDITKRKQMETALRESEEKFSKAFNASPGIMAITTLDGKYVEVNDSFIRTSGFTREETIGRTAIELGIWASQKERARYLQLIKRQGHIYNEEFQFRKKSGELHTLLFSAEQINIGGDPYIISVNYDITQRKLAEKSLQESEEKFSKAFGTASDAMAIIESNSGTFIEVNDSYIKLSGYSRKELVGHTPDELNMWADSRDRERYIKKVKGKGQVLHEEFSFRTKSGEIRTCLISTELFNIDRGTRAISVIQDITEQKQAEAALRESEEKFSKAFNASANAMCIKSLKENRYIEVNDSFTRFTGYTREEVIGHIGGQLDVWVKPEEEKRWMDAIQEDGWAYNQEFSSRMKSGEIRIGLGSSEVINIGGKPCHMTVITDITDRKQAEEALKESEEKFSKAFTASANAICITSLKDNHLLEVNESFVRFTGYSPEELIGHSPAELKLWVKPEEEKRWIDAIQKDGRAYNQEFSSRMKSGEIRIGLASAEIINIGGEPCRMVVITDITERKKAEEGLRLLSSVTQQVSDSTIVTDPQFRINYMNKAAELLFGYSIDEALGKDIGILDAIPLSEAVMEEMRHTLAAGRTWTTILPKRRKDGNTLLCDCTRCPMYNENGHLSSYIVVHHDITEQQQYETKLKAHKQLIESILTSMPEGVLVTDNYDRVILVNDAFRRIFHTHRKAIKNRPLDETIKVDQLRNLYKSIKAGKVYDNTLEFRYQVNNQEKVITCGIIKMGGERMLLTFTDISRIREEEDKLYLMDRLASLGEMAAGLAHELNNPLTGILTLSQLLVNSDLTEEQKEDMQCVYSEAKRAANIVKNVLLFTRNNNYETGQSSVNEVVKEVLRLREHEENVHNISVVTNLEENLPEIPLDKYQLQQVFLNIVLNAEAAMKETDRPGILTITTEQINNHLNITFSDNGDGIKKQILPRIFDPFFTTKDIGKGTGLGLSICYGIVVKHGGKISVKTQDGKGTTFTIRMPIVKQD